MVLVLVGVADGAYDVSGGIRNAISLGFCDNGCGVVGGVFFGIGSVVVACICSGFVFYVGDCGCDVICPVYWWLLIGCIDDDGGC